MNLRLHPASLPPASAAWLGSCGLHVLALLLLAGWLASSPPVTLPQLASQASMTLAAPSAPAPPAKPTPQPVQTKQVPARPAVTPSRKPAPQAKPLAHSMAPTSKPAPVTPEPPSAAPTSPAVTPAPLPAPVIHEPLYRGGYLNNPKPAYPPLAIEMEEAGTVRLRVQVSAQGLPVAVELEQSSGFPRLDRAALSAVRNWKFIPAKRGDEAIPYTFIVPVEFSLKNLRQP